MKIQEKNAFIQIMIVYLLSIIISLLLYFPFDKLYVLLIKPIRHTGGGLFLPISNVAGEIINGSLFAFYFVLSFIVIIMNIRHKYLAWAIGMIAPLSVAIVAGGKDFFYAIIMIFFGWFLAELILKLKARKVVASK